MNCKYKNTTLKNMLCNIKSKLIATKPIFMAAETSNGKQNGQQGNIQHHYDNEDLLSTLKINNKSLMQPNSHEVQGQTNSSGKYINNVLLIGDTNLTNALQKDLAPGCRIQTIRSNRCQDLVKGINNLSKFNCNILCFYFYYNVENEILSIINALKNKNCNALINITESIYSSNY